MIGEQKVECLALGRGETLIEPTGVDWKTKEMLLMCVELRDGPDTEDQLRKFLLQQRAEGIVKALMSTLSLSARPPFRTFSTVSVCHLPIPSTQSQKIA